MDPHSRLGSVRVLVSPFTVHTRRNLLTHRSILFTVIANMAMTIWAPTALYQVGYGFNVVLPCVLSSRILLNLRQFEKYRESQVDVQGVDLSEWPTMFHLTERTPSREP